MAHQHHTHTELSRDQKTLSSYITGFALSFFLTVAAFLIIEWRLYSDTGLYFSLALLAVAQLGIQSLYFLRLNFGREGRWNVFPFLFTMVIIAILFIGTLWIMYNLNYNMIH